MELKYANENKTADKSGWILDFDFLVTIQKQVEDKRYEVDLEDIELILLVANGETDLIHNNTEFD